MKHFVACASAVLILIAFSAMALPVNKAAPHKYSHGTIFKSVGELAIVTMDVTKEEIAALHSEIVSFEKPFAGYVLLKPQALEATVLNKHISTVAHSPPKLE